MALKVIFIIRITKSQHSETPQVLQKTNTLKMFIYVCPFGFFVQAQRTKAGIEVPSMSTTLKFTKTQAFGFFLEV